jgi:nucleotide-binding universal stress UspA family protein
MEHTILVATDGSAAADGAVHAAISLAKRDGARLVVCSVCDDVGMALASSEGYGGTGVELALAGALAFAKDACAAAAARARAAGVDSVVEEVSSGDVSDTILRVARDEHADAVVLGKKWKVGLERLLLGSVAENVLRLGSAPTFVIPSPRDGEPPLELGRRRLLVALDHSGPSDAAFAFALRYAEPETTIVLCMVAEGQDVTDRTRLDQRADEVREAGFAAEVAVVTGAPAPQIVRMARERSADVIILGTHGRRGIEHVILGSVAQAVVRTASLPTIVVHEAVVSEFSSRQR